MRIFVKLKLREGLSGGLLVENIKSLKALVLAQKGDEAEALNCNHIWVEVEKRGDKYFPIHYPQYVGFFIPKGQLEDKVILL